MKNRWITLAAAVIVVLAVTPAQSARVFKAGAAVSNITPPLDEPLVGGWDSPAAEHIHDELHARCLVLDDGETKLALVLVDSLGVSREVCDAAGRIIEDKTGIPAQTS